MKEVTVSMYEIAVPRRWECDRCGFVNAPHINRMRADQHANCEQCGAVCPAIEKDVLTARAKGGEVRYA